MRVAQTERPDLGARASFRDEWVVVRNPVTAVLAHAARRRLLREIRNEPQNLADERVEPLRILSDAEARLAGAAVARADVHHAPLAVAGLSGRVEQEVAERMNARVVGDAHHLARGSFERRVFRVRV